MTTPDQLTIDDALADVPRLTVLRPCTGEDADDFEVLWAPGEGPRGDA